MTLFDREDGGRLLYQAIAGKEVPRIPATDNGVCLTYKRVVRNPQECDGRTRFQHVEEFLIIADEREVDTWKRFLLSE